MNFRLPNFLCRGMRREREPLIEACIASGKTADLQAALSGYRKLNNTEVDQLVNVFVEQGNAEKAGTAANDFGKRKLRPAEYRRLYETYPHHAGDTWHQIVAGTHDADIGTAWLEKNRDKKFKIEPIRGYHKVLRYHCLEAGGGAVTEWYGESEATYCNRTTVAMKQVLDCVRAVTLTENSPAGISCMETIIAARYGSCAHLYEAAQALRVVEWYARWLTVRNTAQGHGAQRYWAEMHSTEVILQIVFENTLPRDVAESLFQMCFSTLYTPPSRFWDEMVKTFRRALKSGVLSPAFAETWVMRYSTWEVRLQLAASLGLSRETQRRMKKEHADEHNASIVAAVRDRYLPEALKIAQKVPLTRPEQFEALIAAAVDQGEGEIALCAAKMGRRRLTRTELAQLARNIKETPVRKARFAIWT